MVAKLIILKAEDVLVFVGYAWYYAVFMQHSFMSLGHMWLILCLYNNYYDYIALLLPMLEQVLNKCFSLQINKNFTTTGGIMVSI